MKIKVGMLQTGRIVIGKYNNEKKQLEDVFELSVADAPTGGITVPLSKKMVQIIFMPPCAIFGTAEAAPFLLIENLVILQDANPEVAEMYQKKLSPLTTVN